MIQAKQTSTRSLSLDILKIVLSFFVIMAHLQPLFYTDAVEGWLLSNGLCRVLVPCFLIISGFFIYSKIGDFKAILKYLFQLGVIYLVWSTFYFCFYYHPSISVYTVLGRFLFGYFQLWYLPALFSGVIILILALKVIKNDLFLFLLILVIYFVGHALDVTRVTYSVMAHFYRNGFFIGFPFLAFGFLIRKYNIKDLLTSKQLVWIMLFSFTTLMIETALYYYDGMKFSDMYLSALLLCPAVVLLCLRHPFKVKNAVWVDYFSDVSAGVYYIHLFFVFKLYSVDYNIVNLPIIFLISVLATIPLIFINRHLPMRLLL